MKDQGAAGPAGASLATRWYDRQRRPLFDFRALGAAAGDDARDPSPQVAGDRLSIEESLQPVEHVRSFPRWRDGPIPVKEIQNANFPRGMGTDLHESSRRDGQSRLAFR